MDVIINRQTARKIVEYGTIHPGKLVYTIPKTKRDKKYRFATTVPVVDFSDRFAIASIAFGGEISTNPSRQTVKKDVSTGMYYMTGYLIDEDKYAEVHIGQGDGQISGLKTDDKGNAVKVTVWTTITLDTTNKVYGSPLDLQLLPTGYYWIVYMYDRWNLFAPCTWRNEEVIF